MTDNLSEFSKRLRQRREEVYGRKSVGLLAQKIGVSSSSVSKYEYIRANELGRLPSGERLLQLAAALNTTVGWLLGEEPRES